MKIYIRQNNVPGFPLLRAVLLWAGVALALVFERKKKPLGDDRGRFPQGFQSKEIKEWGYKWHGLYPMTINSIPQCSMSSTFYVRYFKEQPHGLGAAGQKGMTLIPRPWINSGRK